MFYEVRLYADMTLQVFFFVLSLYGWYIWLTKRGNAAVRPTKRVTRSQIISLMIVLVAVTGGWGYLLSEFTDASIPYADALIATLSLIAQYLLSSKVLENWLIWIVVDVLSIGMYMYKELYTLAFLYLIFLGIATAGWLGWKKEHEQKKQQAVGSLKTTVR
ncbi:Nicotinamide riboside transporter PnuC [compost metagenome]